MKRGIVYGVVCWAVILFGISQCEAAEFYFELGIGVPASDEAAMLPEINLPGPLGKFVLGVEAQKGWSVEYEHISSIPYRETGKGLNVLWFTKRVYF